MDFWTFWQSVAALRRAELVTLIITMTVPLLGGTFLLSLRYRIRTLLERSSQTQTAFYHENVSHRDYTIEVLRDELHQTRGEVSTLKSAHAPRTLTAAQVDTLLDHLSNVQASPVIVSAYAFEAESASYAAKIAGALRKAGWAVTVNKASMNDFKGISLGTVALMHQPLNGLHELAAAFHEAHLDLSQREISMDSIAGQLQDGSLLVVVGRQ